MLIRNYYWSQDQTDKNFGDYIGHWMLERLGCHFSDKPSSCLISCGSIINQGIMRPGTKWVIWGSGIAADSQINESNVRNFGRMKIYSVRGPRTAKKLGYPDLPQGDPALLIPIFYNNRAKKDRVVYVPHWWSYKKVAKDMYGSMKETGADLIINPMVPANHFLSIIDDICTAKFVLTNSLHGAIVAQAYGIPWAPCRTRPEGPLDVFKWTDWFQYLGLENLYPDTVSNYEEGKGWWLGVKDRIKKPQIGTIIKACPLPSSVWSMENLKKARVQ